MTDWKGNIIEVGHTVVTVAVDNPFAGATMVFGFITADGEHIQYDSAPIKKEHLWIPTGEYKIIEGNTVTSYNDDFHHEVPIQFIDTWIPTSNFLNQLIWCIKGMSDNQEEYYLNYFKAE